MALGLVVGVTRKAKRSWVSLEMPETGLRSVSPRARTPTMERRAPRRMERRVACRGIRAPKTSCTAPMQIRMERREKRRTMRVGTRWDGGASGSGGEGEAALDEGDWSCEWWDMCGVRGVDGSDGASAV